MACFERTWYDFITFTYFKNMASASKKNLVRLVSTGGSGTFFVRKANNKDKGKLSMMKFDKKLRKHVMFEEKKMK